MHVTIWTSPSSRTTPSRYSSTSAGGEVQPRVRAHRGAQLAHHGGGAHAAAHHVADHQRGAAGADLDHVVPVAAHLRARDARLVEGRDLELVEDRTSSAGSRLCWSSSAIRALALGGLALGGGGGQRLLGRALRR